MRTAFASVALVAALAGTALADDLAFTFPDPGDDVFLDQGGLSFRFTLPPGTSLIECSIEQGGKVLWTDKVSGGSSACGPDRRDLPKLKAGPASVTMRVKTKAGWSKAVALKVNLVAKTPAEPVKECAGPKCHHKQVTVMAEDTAKTGADVGHPAAANMILGADRGGTWDGTYLVRSGAPNPGFIECPGNVVTRSDHNMGTVVVTGDTVTFDVYIEQPDLTDYPERHATWTAKIAKDGTISGTGKLSEGQVAFLKPGHPDSTTYKFAKHTTFTITGTIATLDTVEHDPKTTVDLESHILQGRRMKVTISDKAGLTIASGKDAYDECDFQARSPEFFQLDYKHSFSMETIYWSEPVHWE